LATDVFLKLHPGELKVMVQKGTARRVAEDGVAETAVV